MNRRALAPAGPFFVLATLGLLVPCHVWSEPAGASQVREPRSLPRAMLGRETRDLAGTCAVLSSDGAGVVDAAEGRRCRQASGDAPGTVMTRPLTILAGIGSKFVVDADPAGGEIRMQVRDCCGNPVPGFRLSDCVPVDRPGGRVPVEWLAVSAKEATAPGIVDLALLDRQTVSLEFRLSGKARLFGVGIDQGREIPMRLGEGPHLFIDDYLIARSENLERVTNHPEKLPRPAIAKEQQPQGKACAGPVVFDAQRKVFRMWHWAPGPEGVRSSVIYRESKDGLNWPGPGKLLFSFNGFGTALVDEGPNCPDPQRRFKMSYFVIAPQPNKALGMYVVFSPDGLTWTEYEGNPVLPMYLPGDERWAEGVGDIIDPYWDPIDRRYKALVKMMSATDKEFGLQSRTARQGLGIRLVGQTESPDFVHWKQPWRVMWPDAADEGVTEFYSGNVLVRGDLRIAFVRILRDDLSCNPGGPIEGLGYTVLATSRDGRNWQRFREPFLDRGEKPEDFDRAMAWAGPMAQVGDRVYIPYTAYNQGHKVGDRQAGMATMARDRFVARQASGDKTGTLKTSLINYTGRKPLDLWVNGECRLGEIRVQVLDADGNVVPGFSFADCRPLTTDALDQNVRWKRPLKELGETPFRLEFCLRGAKVYAFSLAKGTK